jgi:uncharacterized membrane protein YraQ (UPF0718 family)
VVESAVDKDSVTRVMGDDSAKSLATATGPGGMSASCSYASVALARSLFRKGADFTSAMAFADLIIIPILLIYREYHGTKMALFLAPST